jgi:hypothetical protein
MSNSPERRASIARHTKRRKQRAKAKRPHLETVEFRRRNRHAMGYTEWT